MLLSISKLAKTNPKLNTVNKSCKWVLARDEFLCQAIQYTQFRHSTSDLAVTPLVQIIPSTRNPDGNSNKKKNDSIKCKNTALKKE